MRFKCTMEFPILTQVDSKPGLKRLVLTLRI